MGFLSRIDPHIQRLSSYATVATLMVGGYTWLAGELSWFAQMGLAEKVAIAIPAALLTLLAVTAALAMYRYFRPLPVPEAARPPESEPTLPDYSDQFGGIGARLDSLEGQLGQILAARGAEGQDPDFEARLKRLEHNHGNLRDKFLATETVVSGLDKRVAGLLARWARFEPIAEKLEAEEWRKLFAKTERLIETLAPMQPVPGKAWHGVSGMRTLVNETRINHNLRNLGVDIKGLSKRIEAAVANIRSDAKYRLLEGDDAQVWSSADEKQNWYMQQARFNVYKHLLDRVRPK